MILFELLFPLVLVGMILYICQSVMGGKGSEELSQILSSDTNGRCAMMKDWKNQSELRQRRQSNAEPTICQNQLIGVNTLPDTLIFDLINATNVDIFSQYYSQIEKFFKRENCSESNRTTIRQTERKEKESFKEILYSNDSTDVKVVIEIHQISREFFHYDLIVPMIEDQDVRDAISSPRLTSFLLKHQHPSEQLVNLGFLSIKLFDIVLEIFLKSFRVHFNSIMHPFCR